MRRLLGVVGVAWVYDLLTMSQAEADAIQREFCESVFGLCDEDHRAPS